MPIFMRMEADENRIKDVGVIENCVHSLMVLRQKKDRTLIFHILYCLVTALTGYIGIDGNVLGYGGFAGFVCLFAYPALYVYTFLYSPMALKALGALLPLGAYAVRFALFPVADEGFLSFAVGVVCFLICLAIASMMFRTVVNKCTKLWCFTAVTCSLVIGFLAIVAIYSIYSFGSIDMSKLMTTLDDSISFVSSQYGAALSVQLENPEVFASFSAAIPEVSEMTPVQAGEYLGDTLKAALEVCKAMLPGLFVFVCMIYAFIFTGVFSIVARIHSIPLFVCIMDNRWCYRIPSSLITFFDIVLFFVIIGSIFGLPATISLSVMNLLIILLPLVTVCTFKAIHFFLYGKLRSKAKATVLCFVIAVVAMMFMGPWGCLLICSLGISLVTQRYRIECAAAKEKIKLDTQAMLVLCGCKEPSELKNEYGVDVFAKHGQNMENAEDAEVSHDEEIYDENDGQDDSSDDKQNNR